jgi:hypothetical protein
MLRAFASVSAFQTMGMMLTQEVVGWVKGGKVEATVRSRTRVEIMLVCPWEKLSVCW